MSETFIPPYRAWIYKENNPMGGAVGSPPNVNPATGDLGLSLETSFRQPSTYHQVASIGVDLGVPSDSLGQPYSGSEPVRMDVYVEFRFDAGNFLRRREFNSSFLDVSVVAFVDNDRGEGFEAGSSSLVHDDGFAFWDGSESVTPSRRQDSVWHAGQPIRVPPGARYRLFGELHADLRAAGFGGWGGSSVSANVAVTITRLSCTWSQP